jgi:hypothetical protein
MTNGRGFWVLLLGLGGTAAHADDATTALFAGTEPIPITLEAPFAQLQRDDDAEPAYRPATLTWKDATGTDVRIPLEVRPRGKSRREETACEFPPLRLNFPKDGPAGTPFSTLNKVKLVTHCGPLDSDRPQFAQRVELEMLLYRAFNRLSATSFRVRPLDITYVDTGRDNKRFAQPGFLIEPENVLAKRYDAKAADVVSITPADLEPVQANLIEIFEFMIGNTDFSMLQGPEGDHCCHNIVLLAPPNGALLAVPYDFDATGVVNPPYAAPVPTLKIRNVRQRLYRGRCRPQASIDATLSVFREARADIVALFQNDARLDPKAKDETIEYLDAFYTLIDDPKAVNDKITSKCLGALDPR